MRRRGRSSNISNSSTIAVPSLTNKNNINTNTNNLINNNQSTTITTIVADTISIAVDIPNSIPPYTTTSISTTSSFITKAHDQYIEMSHTGGGSRKDDPVFNVKFVQLVESHPCLWNSSLPAYSKKDEIQKAWQSVANDTKDTVRNCRERWRTIRSSFLRSLKQSRTTTGRGKRKYYLSKYLQFLIPYTKTRPKNGHSVPSQHTIATRKAEADAALLLAAAATATNSTVCPPSLSMPMTLQIPPMTQINQMPMPVVSSDDTKDSTNSEIAIAEEDVVVSLHEGGAANPAQQTQTSTHPSHIQSTQTQQVQQTMALPLPLPRCAVTIKSESGVDAGLTDQQHCTFTNGACSSKNNTNNNNNTHNNNFGMDSAPMRSSSAVDLTEFAEWIKSRNEHRHCITMPDADQSFLNSLHPYLKEMTGKQNRRFRQKVVALIDNILDNVD